PAVLHQPDGAAADAAARVEDAVTGADAGQLREDAVGVVLGGGVGAVAGVVVAGVRAAGPVRAPEGAGVTVAPVEVGEDGGGMGVGGGTPRRWGGGRPPSAKPPIEPPS